MRAFSFNTTVTTAGRLPLAHCVYFKAPTVPGLQMFSLNQMMSSISQSATLLSFHFSGNLNVSHWGDAGEHQMRHMETLLYWVMLHLLPQHLLLLVCWVSPRITKRLWEFDPTGNREKERVMDEKWTLCQRAKCPRSEPLLFTGSRLIPVRELSASGLIWAGFPLCPDQDDPPHPQHNALCLSLLSLL